MGFFNNLFGKKKGSYNISDGQWLDFERNSSWRKAFYLNNGKQAVEVSTESCYSKDGVSYAIIRSIDEGHGNTFYCVCYNIDNDDEEVYFLITRVEAFDGRVAQKDLCFKGEMTLSVRTNKNVANLIAMMRNLSRFNNYTSVPPYLQIAFLKLPKS